MRKCNYYPVVTVVIFHKYSICKYENTTVTVCKSSVIQGGKKLIINILLLLLFITWNETLCRYSPEIPRNEQEPCLHILSYVNTGEVCASPQFPRQAREVFPQIQKQILKIISIK